MLRFAKHRGMTVQGVTFAFAQDRAMTAIAQDRGMTVR